MNHPQDMKNSTVGTIEINRDHWYFRPFDELQHRMLPLFIRHSPVLKLHRRDLTSRKDPDRMVVLEMNEGIFQAAKAGPDILYASKGFTPRKYGFIGSSLVKRKLTRIL